MLYPEFLIERRLDKLQMVGTAQVKNMWLKLSGLGF
jgi:hypothetical protein